MFSIKRSDDNWNEIAALAIQKHTSKPFNAKSASAAASLYPRLLWFLVDYLMPKPILCVGYLMPKFVSVGVCVRTFMLYIYIIFLNE